MLKLKITDVKRSYKLKFRLCVNGSKVQEGIDFKESYFFITDSYLFILIFAVGKFEGKILYLLHTVVAQAFIFIVMRCILYDVCTSYIEI